MLHETFAIGCAAGFGGDRTDAAAPIVETLIARYPPSRSGLSAMAEAAIHS